MKTRWIIGFLLALGASQLRAADQDLDRAFRQPDAQARPWAYWYWLNAAVTEPAIDADLRAMKAAGLEGAYLMPIKGPLDPAQINPPATQLSPLFWRYIRHAFTEADRLGIKLAMHDCDGFATAGGPWITPALSMQRMVWSETELTGGSGQTDWTLPAPAAQLGFYQDVAVLALPAPEGAGETSQALAPQVASGNLGGAAASHPNYLGLAPTAPLATYGQVPPGMPIFTSEHPCWISFAFARPFTCRAITIRTANSGTYTANRPQLEASDDGVHYRTVARLASPRHGWEDWELGVTHAVPPTTARYFRLVYDGAGIEPGAEDLDSAKWSTLKLLGVEFLAAERIDNFEGKSGAIWRIAPARPVAQPTALDRVIDLTSKLDSSGRLRWTAPAGRWTILRMGSTTTAHYNETGGGGRGLECDKFNPEAAKLQFDRWFGEAQRQIGPAIAGRTLPIFHIDSWECGSQNWSPVFAAEFRRRRGYDLTRYLPAMAGFAVESSEVSERFLRDVRRTIAELVVDNFYRPMADLAHEHGCAFSAESVAPTFVSDGMAHFAVADLPMGEFWLRSATHDKLNDVLDAVSGARVYGKRIAQSEAFTELHLGWDEAPGLLKPLADRNYAFGMNRYVYHVFMLNPWLDRRPGLTLNGVGTFFQRDQTWWDGAGRTWTDYAARCQSLLQQGAPAADLAVFTGEEVPRRALVPWELAGTLPAVLRSRLGTPSGHPPIWKSEDWIDPLNGYAYDSINRDALLRLAQVKDGRIVLPGGASYAALIVPGSRPMQPDAAALTPETAEKLRALAEAGATIILGEEPLRSSSLEGYPDCDRRVRELGARLWASPHVRRGVWQPAGFESIGLERDFEARDAHDAPLPLGQIAWTHRRGDGWELYFVSNQTDTPRSLRLSLRAAGTAEIWNPVTGEQSRAAGAGSLNGRSMVPVCLPAYGSVFVVLRPSPADPAAVLPAPQPTIALDADWSVQFDPARGGPAQPLHWSRLISWTERPEESIRHFSGTAIYRRSFQWDFRRGEKKPRIWLNLGRVGSLGRVTVNGADCGVAWTPPFRVEITSAVREGENQVEIAVTNPWRNRLIGDSALAPAERSTWTNARDLPKDAPLLSAGLLGPVALETDRAAPPPSAEMQRVYAEVKTPFKRGVILQPGPDELFDCPSVFRFGSSWYMIFVSIKHSVGYETRLARSNDLLHWTVLGTILPFSGQGWDAAQADGGAALVDPTWNGSQELEKYRGRYWLSYLGGAKRGYEPDPLSIGLAFTAHPDRAEAWQRLPTNPILAPDQPDARPWEQATLFKSTILRDPARTLGAPFVMFYNAKQKGPWVERIGSAVSDDLVHWRRTIPEPAIDAGRGISGDPQLVRMGDLWVMFYFGAGWGKGSRAFDTFACSRDLVHWEKWTGPYLIASTEPWDSTFAHKPWVLKHDGVVYHFYCAVDHANRAIALATSRELPP